MSKYVKSNGFLSDEGKTALAGFSNEMMRLLSSPEVMAMDEVGMRSFGACLCREVKEVVSQAILNKRNKR